MNHQQERPFVVGTRRVDRDGTVYRVRCATCGGGGSTPYRYREDAVRAAVAQSARPCQCKGCSAR